MRKLMTMALAAAMLAACGGGGDGGDDRAADDRRPADRSTTTVAEAPDPPTTAEPTTTVPATTEPPAPATTTTVPAQPATATGSRPDGRRFICPEGGIDEVRALQRAVDEGHQPWRLSAESVAASCTFSTGTVEPAGTDRYRVTDPATGDAVLVDVARPLGPGTIWVVTRVTPA